MSGLVFYSSVNTRNKNDATGAFIPEAKDFATYYSIPSKDVIGIDCVNTSKTHRMSDVLYELNSRVDLDLLMFFGHGWPGGIQFGIDNKAEHMEDMVSRINSKDIRVGLFACLTAENDVRDNDVEKIGVGTDGGFADSLRDMLASRGISGWVDAHKTAGHATWNPYVVRFEMGDDSVGGKYIVEPFSKYWRTWVSSLKNNTRNLRYHFLTMSQDSIVDMLDDIEQVSTRGKVFKDVEK